MASESARTHVKYIQDWIEKNISDLSDVSTCQDALNLRRQEFIQNAFEKACSELKPGDVFVTTEPRRRIDPLKVGMFSSQMYYTPLSVFTVSEIDLRAPQTDIAGDWSFYVTSIAVDPFIKHIIKVHQPKDPATMMDHDVDVIYPLCNIATFTSPGIYYYLTEFEYQDVRAFVHDHNGRFYHYNIEESKIDSFEDFDLSEKFNLERFCLLKFEEYIEPSQKKQRTD